MPTVRSSRGEHAGIGGWIPYLGLGGRRRSASVIAWLGYQARLPPRGDHAAAAGPSACCSSAATTSTTSSCSSTACFYLGLGAVVGWIDRYVIDGAVNFVTWLTWRDRRASWCERVQTGRAQDALYAIAIGFLLLALLALRG